MRLEILLSAAPLWGAIGVFYGCVVTLVDVTERGRAARVAQEAAAAHALNAGLIRGQEEERRRLARELHDGLNQKLVALTLRIRGMENRLDPVFHDELRILERWAEEVCEETRRVSHELHPATLEHLGLVASLRGLCREFSEQSGVNTEFAVGELPTQLSHEVSTCLYRVAQEALSNVAKHARGSDAGVMLLLEQEGVCLRITDWGKGFDVESARGHGGLGLTSMQERLRLLGGRLDIESKPGEGAVVIARIPLNAGKTHSEKASSASAGIGAQSSRA